MDKENKYGINQEDINKLFSGEYPEDEFLDRCNDRRGYFKISSVIRVVGCMLVLWGIGSVVLLYYLFKGYLVLPYILLVILLLILVLILFVLPIIFLSRL